jgi:zinc protease
MISLWCSLAAATELPEPSTLLPDARFEPTHQALDSGDTLVVLEDHRAPLAYVIVRWPTGTLNPWFRDNAWAAWDLAKQDPEGELAERADAMSATVSFNASGRYVSASVSCLRADLPDALDLLQDIWSAPELDGRELRRMRQGVRLEWKANLKSPVFQRSMAMEKGLYVEGDVRRDDVDGPRSLPRSTARLVEARNVVVHLPGRTVGVAGDVTQADAEALVAGLLPAPRDPGVDVAVPEMLPVIPRAQRPDRTEVEIEGLTQAYLGVYRDSLVFTDPEYPAQLVAQHVLGGHFGSRLNTALRHDLGATYGANASGGAGHSARVFALQTSTQAERADEVEQVLLSTLEAFWQDGITAQEHQDTLRFLLGREAFAQQAPWGALRGWMWSHMLGYPQQFDRASKIGAAAMDLDDINAFIRDFYDPEQFAVVVVGPPAE